MYKYVCPNCKTRIESRVPLVYCVCGGKYNNTTILDDAVAMAESLFGKDLVAITCDLMAQKGFLSSAYPS